jgi:hypothetical protein
MLSFNTFDSRRVTTNACSIEDNNADAFEMAMICDDKSCVDETVVLTMIVIEVLMHFQ